MVTKPNKVNKKKLPPLMPDQDTLWCHLSIRVEKMMTSHASQELTVSHVTSSVFEQPYLFGTLFSCLKF